jgi:phosphate uptake regulator
LDADETCRNRNPPHNIDELCRSYLHNLVEKPAKSNQTLILNVLVLRNLERIAERAGFLTKSKRTTESYFQVLNGNLLIFLVTEK